MVITQTLFHRFSFTKHCTGTCTVHCFVYGQSDCKIIATLTKTPVNSGEIMLKFKSPVASAASLEAQDMNIIYRAFLFQDGLPSKSMGCSICILIVCHGIISPNFLPNDRHLVIAHPSAAFSRP